MFYHSNELFIGVSLNACAAVFQQFMITLIDNYLFQKLLLGCFFASSTGPYLYFLWSEGYFPVVIEKYLSSNPSSRCFPFSHNIP